jgi:hypothetical protein
MNTLVNNPKEIIIYYIYYPSSLLIGCISLLDPLGGLFEHAINGIRRYLLSRILPYTYGRGETEPSYGHFLGKPVIELHL